MKKCYTSMLLAFLCVFLVVGTSSASYPGVSDDQTVLTPSMTQNSTIMLYTGGQFGSIYHFGHVYIDNASSNSQHPVEWVLVNHAYGMQQEVGSGIVYPGFGGPGSTVYWEFTLSNTHTAFQYPLQLTIYCGSRTAPQTGCDAIGELHVY